MQAVGTLAHDLLRLEPLSAGHVAAMAAGAPAPGQLPEFATVPVAAEVSDYVAASLARAAAGETMPFAQVLADGRVVGHTSLLTPRYWPGGERLLAIEIGSTWLSPAVQGTAVNSVAKLLLMTHAFEEWEVARLDIKTDARNAQARAGIEAVGASLEGVLAAWQPSQAPREPGLVRNTAMHSVRAADWPEVKAALRRRIAAKVAAAAPAA